MNIATKLLAGGSVPCQLIEQAELNTFVNVKEPVRAYTSFFWRLALASIIAAGGIAGDSTAVVVGAMLVAPLMLPMTGTMLAIVRGNGKAIIRTLAITGLGIALSIALAALVVAIVPVHVDTSANSQVLARVSPRLVDLVVALAAGFIGALSVIRKDIPDAAPGIAIAVSLVPPLCVVGISLYEGDLASAAGAFLLFAANYFAIETTALVVFLLTGVGKNPASEEGKRAQTRWYAAAVIGLIAVTIPLAGASYSAVSHAQAQSSASAIARQWLEGTGYEANSVKVTRNHVDAEIAGQGETPSVEGYLALLEENNVPVDSASVVILREEKASAAG